MRKRLLLFWILVLLIALQGIRINAQTAGTVAMGGGGFVSGIIAAPNDKNVQVTKYHGRATWNFAAKGIEETVPQDMVSIPGDPIVSVIGDYDDQHQYGGIAIGEFVVGDENTYGLVYTSTAGRGIAWMKGNGTTVPVTGVTLTPTTVSLIAGATTQLSATIAPANATNKTVTWTSDSTSIATVSSIGLVTGVAAGAVTTQDGAKTASCVVTV